MVLEEVYGVGDSSSKFCIVDKRVHLGTVEQSSLGFEGLFWPHVLTSSPCSISIIIQLIY